MDVQTTNAPLSPETCRRARLSRDARFDGEFYLAVSTTGIYCRPVCPARPPAEKNVTYFRSAAEAAGAGYRPCLRCRPESAPGSPAWLGTSTTVHRAVNLIQGGALNDTPVAELAERLGVGERYLRKLFTRELGVSPQALATNQRLLFARKLLAETSLPITQIAYASGFGSVRRFNSAIKTQFRQTPGDLRRQKASRDTSAAITLSLHYRPPYDWPGVIGFFSRHAIEGVEEVSLDSYHRNLRFSTGDGWLTVKPLDKRNALQLTLQLPDNGLLMPTVANIRRMFDLDANPGAIAAVLSHDTTLAGLLKRFPGIRSPGSWSLFESAIRTIVGQQVSTVAARSVLSRLARECSAATLTSQSTRAVVTGTRAVDTGTKAVDTGTRAVDTGTKAVDTGTKAVFPSAEALAALPDASFPMPGRRRETLQALCREFSGREDELDVESLPERRGIGPWTTAMVAMRGAGRPDVFPPKDLGLENAWTSLGPGGNSLSEQAANWQPWGAYAANLLWRSLSA